MLSLRCAHVQVVRILEAAKSTYHPAFQRLCKEVEMGRDEANDSERPAVALGPQGSQSCVPILATSFTSVGSSVLLQKLLLGSV